MPDLAKTKMCYNYFQRTRSKPAAASSGTDCIKMKEMCGCPLQICTRLCRAAVCVDADALWHVASGRGLRVGRLRDVRNLETDGSFTLVEASFQGFQLELGSSRRG